MTPTQAPTSPYTICAWWTFTYPDGGSVTHHCTRDFVARVAKADPGLKIEESGICQVPCVHAAMLA